MYGELAECYFLSLSVMIVVCLDCIVVGLLKCKLFLMKLMVLNIYINTWVS